MAGHVTLEEREVLAQRRAAGASMRMIAMELDRNPSTISHELRRNRSGNCYFPSKAQEEAAQRRRDRRLVRKMDQPEVNRMVRKHLKEYWSPDQIAGRSKLLFANNRKCQISRQSIYTWIHAQTLRGKKWTRYLRRYGKTRRGRENRGKLADTTPIAGRPKIAERRGRLGDWEGDTVHGSTRGGLLTLVDRKSRFLLMGQIDDLTAATVLDVAIDALHRVPRHARKTATFDNGKEFARHEELSRRTGLAVYFARPYSAWQRGTNENTNGLIRQFYPKGTDLVRQARSRISQVQDLLNHRPRRCLGYRTPHEAFTNIRPRCD